MKKLSLILAVALLPLVGCIQPEDKSGTSFCEGRCAEPTNNEPNKPKNNVTPPHELPLLEGTFIAGHLGSYWDCPDEAYGGTQSDNVGADFAEGACLEGSECPTFTSCESAQVTLTLSNPSDTGGENILIDQIELFGTDGISRAVLPLEATIDTATNEPFDGQLAAGEEVMLRVEFQGPLDPWQLLQPMDGDTESGDRIAGGGGIIEATFSSDNHADLTVESSALYDVPAVDT